MKTLLLINYESGDTEVVGGRKGGDLQNEEINMESFATHAHHLIKLQSSKLA